MPDGPSSDQDTVAQALLNSTLNGTATADNLKPGAPHKIPHITDRFIPISHIIAVLVRSSYLDLRKLRESLIDVSDQQRKRRIVGYTQKYRAEFAKLLVLTTWSTRADDISRAIDLRAWLQGQKNCFDNVYGMLRFDVLANLNSAKLPAPDLQTAIDVLSTGTLSSARNKAILTQFQVPETLDSAAILETLRTLNSLLNLRLSLHEYLPSRMKVYSVASGRATFNVTNEFLVDVFFATQNTSATDLQWFLVDFRFAFTEDDHVHTPLEISIEIEKAANSIMARTLSENAGKHQLVELYNFLHRFTMQYKLERLFNQFSSMGTRDQGRVDLKYASSQRVLVVGFWLRKREKDNSITNSFTVTLEDGEASLTEAALATERIVCDYNRERLCVKVRKGAAVINIDNINTIQCNAHDLLTRVICLQSRSIISEIHNQLLESKFTFTCTTSSLSDDNVLSVSLISSECLELCVDKFKGTLLVSLVDRDCQTTHQTFKPSEDLEAALNYTSDPVEQAKRIHDFKFRLLKDYVEELAASAAWSCPNFPLASLNLDEFGRAFAIGDTLASPNDCLFLTRLQEGWKLPSASSWFIVITLRPTGLDFWITELVVDEKSSRWRIQWVEKLDLGQAGSSICYSTDLNIILFHRLRKLSTARVISLQISRGLADNYIDHEYERQTARPVWNSLSYPIIRFRASEISKSRHLWTTPFLTVDFSSLCADSIGGAVVSFIGQKNDEYQFFDLSQCGDIEVSADPSSRIFSLNFKAAVSQSSNAILDRLCSKWKIIENTIGFVIATAKSPQTFLVESIGLHLARFFYRNEYVIQLQQQESALVGDRIDLTINLGSTTNKVNPHIRILDYLAPLVQSLQSSPEVIFKILDLTFPVLETLSRIEQENFDYPECYILTRSFEEYRLYYPRKGVTLLLRARPAPKSDRLPPQYRKMSNRALWHFTDASQSASSRLIGQSKIDSCEKIFNQGLNEAFQTDETFPEGTGIGCTEELAARVLMEVHRTIMEHQRNAGTLRSWTSTGKNDDDRHNDQGVPLQGTTAARLAKTKRLEKGMAARAYAVTSPRLQNPVEINGVYEID